MQTGENQRVPGAGWLFARTFLRHPRRTGALLPSSRFLVDRMLRQVDWERAVVVVEFGPGLGCFTAEILRRMRPDAALLALEMDARFARLLRRTLRDPRLHVRHASALDVEPELRRLGWPQADCIISSLPFGAMPSAVRHGILRRTHNALHPGAQFVLFQYRQLLAPLLTACFGRVERDFEPLNIPPAHIFCCRK
jgi:phospholipid N-methyltransferase